MSHDKPQLGRAEPVVKPVLVVGKSEKLDSLLKVHAQAEILAVFAHNI